MNHAFGSQMQVVPGYSGSAAFNLAVQRGETDGALTTWNNVRNSHADQLRDKNIRVIFHVSLSRNAELPNVPLALDMAKNDDDRALMEFMSSSAELGQSFIAPPEVPALIVAALRRRLRRHHADSDYIKLSQQAGNVAQSDERRGPLTALNDRTLATPQKGH